MERDFRVPGGEHRLVLARGAGVAAFKHHGGGAFCVEALDEAIARYGPLEIFNSDQGARFTSEKFTSVCSGAACKFRWTGKVAASTTSSSGDCGEV